MFQQGPVVEQCITERATLHKYIWNKNINKKMITAMVMIMFYQT